VEIKTYSIEKMIQLSTQSPTKIFSFIIENADFPEPVIELSNIRKIVVTSCNEKWENFFKKSQFPNIEQLWIDFQPSLDYCECRCESKEMARDYMDAILSGMKNLKHLFVQPSMSSVFGNVTNWSRLISVAFQHILELVYMALKVH
jgi:hypothetical protein